jgi:predicted nucleic acid-binding Zn ribbon protein
MSVKVVCNVCGKEIEVEVDINESYFKPDNWFHRFSKDLKTVEHACSAKCRVILDAR